MCNYICSDSSTIQTYKPMMISLNRCKHIELNKDFVGIPTSSVGGVDLDKVVDVSHNTKICQDLTE